MNKGELNEEIFADWLQHPVTEALKLLLQKWRDERKEEWEKGDALTQGQQVYPLLNAAAVGECTGFRLIQELDFEKLRGELEDD